MSDRSEQRWRQLADSPIDDRIDEICDDFERAWIRGARPDMAEYLQLVEPTDRALLFRELLLVDVDYRRRLQLPLEKSAYLHGYPEFAAELETIDLAIDLDDTLASRRRDLLPARRAAGQLVGRFELIEKVGAGAGGEVWKARDGRLLRNVAVKIAHARTDDELLRFVREGRAVAQLKHPNIVAVHDAWHGDGVAYLVSDFYEGADLKRRLEREPVDARQAAEICATLADALQYAHQCGVIHRDLKPANILLDEHGAPHIADFGLAKFIDDAQQVTLDGQLLGTVAYMSPEQARGDAAAADSRTDVYALGIILYEMLAGACPYSGDQGAVLHSILTDVPAPPRWRNPKTPRDLETICFKAIEREVDNRYATAGEMAADLRRFLRGEPIVARRPHLVAKSWRYLRRRPAMVACALFALAALGALAAMQSLRAKQRELLGVKTVTLATEPAGARVVFFALNKTTLAPIPAALVEADGRSPVAVDLAPGYYLVVAALDDGRFHEVIRRVPEPGESLGNPIVGASQDLWTSRPHGGIALRTIKIPDSAVTDDMVQVAVGDAQTTSQADRRRGRSVLRPFFVDRHEYSVAERAQSVTGQARKQNLPPNFPALVPYPIAMQLAEQAGKRLPTAEEVEFLAAGGANPTTGVGHSTAESSMPLSDAHDIGPIDDSRLDRSSADAAIVGVSTNAPEWTTSVLPGIDGNGGAVVNMLDQATVATTCRLATGGRLDAVQYPLDSTRGSVNPLAHYQVRLDDTSAAVGFRCYRSVRPRLTAQDFELHSVKSAP